MSGLLTRQLVRKFGADAVRPYRGQLQEADADTLMRWCEHLLKAESVAESAQEQQKIEILTAAAEHIVPDLVAEIGTPPCWIIKNNRAVWQGMTSCVPGPLAAVRWRGLRVRYRLPYVAVHEALLRDSTFGDALGTYLHELAHVFGGDSSASFSDALTEMMAAVCGQAKVLEQLQQRWVN